MQNTQYSRPMNINNDQLGDIVVEIARQRFGSGIFRRRPLMTAVETHLLQIGAWTPEDDALSSSVGIKSEGLAKIDACAWNTVSGTGIQELKKQVTELTTDLQKVNAQLELSKAAPQRVLNQ